MSFYISLSKTTEIIVNNYFLLPCMLANWWCSVSFLRERDYVMFGSFLSQFRLSSVCPSVCLSVMCPSSVTLVHPTQEVEAFGNSSLPLCTLAILWPPCKILRRSSLGNPSVGSVKRKKGITRAHHGWDTRTWRDVSSYLFTYLPRNYDTPVIALYFSK